MSEHTPGPWEATQMLDAQCAINAPGLWHELAIVYGNEDGEDVYHEQGCANASLIAAAPDLLAALRQLLYGTDCELDSENRHVFRFTTAQLAQARTAIGKAMPIGEATEESEK